MPRNYDKSFESQNYKDKNEGQSRYAHEQYQLARVRRGIISDRPKQNPEESEFDDEDMPQGDVHMLEGNTGGGKRKGESVSSTSGGKQQKVSGASSGTSLPGTGHGTEAPDVPMGGDMEPISTIGRPLVPNPHHVFKFRKQHKFFTYGLAYNILSATDASGNAQMITPLAQVPWEFPWFYMNRNEFNGLGRGAMVSRISIKVIQRNVRIAFETASSSTNLATLNQNKNGICAYGLNKTVAGINVHAKTFNDTKKMICIGVADADYTNQPEKWYGYQSDATNILSEIPRHQVGLPWALKNYYMMKTYTAGVNTGMSTIGWPCLQAYIKEFDAETSAGQVICEHSYSPKMGLLSEPLPYVHGVGNEFAQPTTWNRPRGALDTSLQQDSITGANPTMQGATCTVSTHDNTLGNVLFSTDEFYRSRIEKSQILRPWITGPAECQVQPSVHIGINPILALTSDSITDDKIINYTDAQSYYDVTCEMEVVCPRDVEYPVNSSFTYQFNTRDPSKKIVQYVGGNMVDFEKIQQTNPLLNGLMVLPSNYPPRTRDYGENNPPARAPKKRDVDSDDFYEDIQQVENEISKGKNVKNPVRRLFQ